MLQWSVAIFACNEERSLARCIECVVAESEGAQIHVVVNGSTDRSLSIARQKAREHPNVSAHYILHADKQNAWNRYIHDLRPVADVHFFVDAYAYVAPGSFRALAQAIKPGVNAAAALPGSGRSRKRLSADLRAGGHLHGSLHALSGDFVERIRSRNIRLPIGMYRGDGLIGAMALYDLEPVSGRYDLSRIAVAESASWTFDELKPWRWADVRRQARRFVRQHRGTIESQAFRRVAKARGFEALPHDADTMIADYLANGGTLVGNPVEVMIQRYAIGEPGRSIPAERLSLVTA